MRSCAQRSRTEERMVDYRCERDDLRRGRAADQEVLEVGECTWVVWVGHMLAWITCLSPRELLRAPVVWLACYRC